MESGFLGQKAVVTMKLAGLILWAIFALPCALAVLLAPLALLIFPTERMKPVIRCMDHLTNAALFAGSAYESVSSHSWRERDRWWAKLVIAFCDVLQKGHCEEANKREQPRVDFMEGVAR